MMAAKRFCNLVGTSGTGPRPVDRSAKPEALQCGPWLKKTWLRPGQRDEWVPKVLQVTGKPLGPEAFVEAVRRET